MLSKKEIKDIQSLSLKKFRDELNWFVAEGPKIVNELIQIIPGWTEKIYATAAWIGSHQSPDKLSIVEISETELQRISHLKTPNQVVAVFKKLPSELPDASSPVLYLDTIQDPGNFGTIVRIADWFGVKNIVCSKGCADLYNPKVIQSTMASIARVNVYYDEGEEWLENQSVPVFAATLHGKLLSSCSQIEKGVLIVGNESRGVRPEILRFATEQVTIPKKGEAESLNAAVATGIILSHLLA